MTNKYIPVEYLRAMMMRHSFRSPDMTVTEFTDILKSADVRPNVSGEWIKGGEQPYFRKHFDIVVCSVCNRRGEQRWNFCPWCGSDMRAR